MRHGSHGCACFRRFADYRKRKELNNPARLVVRAGRASSGVTAAPRDLGRPQQTTTRSSGGRQPPVPPLPDHSVGRSTWPVRAHGRSCRSLRFCVPDDRDPLHHRVLTVQALLGPFGASRWHGERVTVDLSDQPIRLPHFAPRTRQATISIAWFESSCWALDRRSLQLAAVRRRRSSQCKSAD
jgi:hypothetical protein